MSGTYSSRNRRLDLFDGQDITATNVSFNRRKLAGTFGEISRSQVYTMHTDIIFESLDQEALGPNSISSNRVRYHPGEARLLEKSRLNRDVPLSRSPLLRPLGPPNHVWSTIGIKQHG